jgi:hypothetical protein
VGAAGAGHGLAGAGGVAKRWVHRARSNPAIVGAAAAGVVGLVAASLFLSRPQGDDPTDQAGPGGSQVEADAGGSGGPGGSIGGSPGADGAEAQGTRDGSAVTGAAADSPTPISTEALSSVRDVPGSSSPPGASEPPDAASPPTTSGPGPGTSPTTTPSTAPTTQPPPEPEPEPAPLLEVRLRLLDVVDVTVGVPGAP